MKKENASVGLKVSFSRPNGVKARGVIGRCNPKKAKVRVIAGGRAVGPAWSVPYSMMEPDRKHAEDMSQAARDLNDAVMERDLNKACALIILQGKQVHGSYGRTKFMLEATFHFDRTADDRDWEWLLENLPV